MSSLAILSRLMTRSGRYTRRLICCRVCTIFGGRFYNGLRTAINSARELYRDYYSVLVAQSPVDKVNKIHSVRVFLEFA